MASIPKTSTALGACLSCRGRKTKCGKEHPSCSQCVKAGWACPGYAGPTRFIHTGERSVSRGNRPHSVIFSTGPNSKAKRALNTPARPSIAPSMPCSEDDKLRLTLVSQLQDSNRCAVSVFLPSHSFLNYLPARIGASSALDDAVRSLCCATLSTIDESPDISDYMLRSGYVKALTSLQKALCCSESALAVETLAATMLLQIFEQYTDATTLAWVQHAGGAVKLLELRGPQTISDGIDLALLESQVGRINFECIRKGQRSFLAQPSWQAVFDQCKSFTSVDNCRLSNTEWEYHRIVSHLPGLIKDYIHWQQDLLKTRPGDTVNCHNPADSAIHEFEAALYKNLTRFRSDIKLWRTENAEHIRYKTDLPDGKCNDSRTSALDTRRTTLRTRMALNCLWPTFTIIASHMMVQIQSEGSLDSFQPCKLDKAVQKGQSLFVKEDLRCRSLVADCLECRDVVLEAYEALLENYRIPAHLIKESLSLIWRKVTDLHPELSDPRSNSVLEAVGSLW